MKATDYGPRIAPFDACLTGRDLVGVEVGVDVGAHAEALLRYCDVYRLILVDPWPKEFYRGWCEGRLKALGLWCRVQAIQQASHLAAKTAGAESLDFIYCDQEHGYIAVKHDLESWWPALKPGGLFGYRNYSTSEPELKRAVDEFVVARNISIETLPGEIVLRK